LAIDLLEKDFLRKLEYLYLVAKEGFQGLLTAARLSKSFGSGLEFAEHREYIPGDDFRHIDWNVYLRIGKPMLKLYQKEEELFVYILVDASKSMDRGTPSKLDFAKKIAASLAYVGLANDDRVTVGSFTSQLGDSTNAAQGKGRLFDTLRFLGEMKGEGQTDMARALAAFLHKSRRKGLVILISDFFDPGGFQRALKQLHHAHYDFFTIQINEPEEIKPTIKGDLEIIDCESGEKLQTQVAATALQLYQEELERHYGELRNLCKSLREGHVAAVTDQPFEDVVLDVLRRGGLLR
jgi:uncharacterized protein (DUF58 family)